MSAPKTTLESRKHRAAMRNHALEWRQHVNGECCCCMYYLEATACEDSQRTYLDCAKSYRDMALAEECEKRQPGEPAAF